MKRYFWSFLQKIIEFFCGLNKNGASVLMFHDVGNDVEAWRDRSTSITADSFEKLIGSLVEKKAAFEPVGALKKASKRGAYVITFDDMFLSAYENAIPVLEKNSIPYCVFISDKFIGAQGYIDEEKLKKLSESPLCTVGFHSVSHAMFRDLSEQDISNELNSEKTDNITGQRAEYFAFPYGSLYACGFKKAKPAGIRYKYSFSTVSARCTDFWLKNYPYYLPRINICEDNYRSAIK